MINFSYLKSMKIIKVSTDETNGKNINFSDLKIVISVPTHKRKIVKSLQRKSLFIGGIELLINPNL